MTKEEAELILQYHSFTNEDISHPKMIKGFLGMLRPFRGVLYEDNFHEVMTAIKTLSQNLREGEMVDRKVIANLWGICHLTRSWAINSEGMLQSNRLVTKEQVETLEKWVDTISFATFAILDGCDDETAFNFYKDSSI